MLFQIQFFRIRFKYILLNTILDSSHSEGLLDGHATASKKEEKEEILIPEKASSFKFHPGRLCEDQCYYCSGKFGLYDTPCHVGQIKSVERQQKILASKSLFFNLVFLNTQQTHIQISILLIKKTHKLKKCNFLDFAWQENPFISLFSQHFVAFFLHFQVITINWIC